MNIVTAIMLGFSLLGALDRIIGNRFGLGAEFEKGFSLLGTLCLSMVGMITIAPVIGTYGKGFFDGIYALLGLDPSVVPSAILANDMGGAELSLTVARDPLLGSFNGYVVSSMMGCLISFTLPYALGVVKKEHHRDVFFGMLCGVVTIPAGCFIGGVIAGVPIPQLAYDLLPLIILAAVIALGLVLCPSLCVKIFGAFGTFMRVLITLGLALGIFEALSGITVIEGLNPVSKGALICFDICVVLSGAFPFMFVLSKLLRKPLCFAGRRLGISEEGALGFPTTLINSAPTFEKMNGMNKKGVILNSAFAVSAGFALGDHLAFTMAYDQTFLAPLIIGKISAGVLGAALAALLCMNKKSASREASGSAEDKGV